MGNYFEFFKSVFLDEISDKFLIFKRMDAMTLFYTVNKIKSNQKDFFRAAPSLFEAVDLGLCFFCHNMSYHCHLGTLPFTVKK